MGSSSTSLDASVDALSDVLELIHLRGEALTVVRADAGTDVEHTAGERMLHIVERGPVGLLVGESTWRLEQGDMALLATGAAHRLRSTAGAAWMTGRFLVEETAAGPLLAVLPPAVVLHGADAGLEWLPLAAGLLTAELADPSAGSRVMVSRLLDLLFIKGLRAWSADDGASSEPGWLTAALDRPLGPAMRAIHRHPEQPWSVEELAELTSMSRAAFAGRFSRLVGEPPGRYLTRLRLARAADQLSASTDSIGSIGKAVGYESEAAFSRAFAREYGVAPRAWRGGERAQD